MSRSALRFPHPVPPEHGQTLTIARGVRWIRMPLPFKLDHINLWLLEDDEFWTIIDAGIASDSVQTLWQQIFARDLRDKPVGRVIVTHFHPDHFGSAGWLAALWNVSIQMSATEWEIGNKLALGPTEESAARSLIHARRCGFEKPHTASTHEKDNYYVRLSPLPLAYTRLREGDRLAMGGREWRVIIGEGHSPEHVCLWSETDHLLIAGDQVLARISPNISVWPADPEADPLAQFLLSMRKLRELPEDTLVLPSHGLPFFGLHSRLDELVQHHDERLTITLEACREPRTVKDLVPRLFPKLTSDQFPFAIGETLAHLNHLLRQSKLERELRGETWYFRGR